MTKKEFIESLYWPLIVLVFTTVLLSGLFQYIVIVGFWWQFLEGLIQGTLWVIVVRLFMRWVSKKLDRVVTHPERVEL